jgi:hypothetical protein
MSDATLEKTKKKEVGVLSSFQLDLIDQCVSRLSQIIQDADEFRNLIATEIINLKAECFGGHFDLRGYEERFLLFHISDKIGFSVQTLRNWIAVLLSVDGADILGYDELGFGEKLAVVRDIRQNKKKATEAIKDHYADKSDPVKKKIFYLERYLGQSLSTARSLEELSFKPTAHQKEIIDSFKVKLKLTLDLIERIGTSSIGNG